MEKRTSTALPYIVVWIILSSSTIFFNKYILTSLNFHFPIFLTACHMLIASIATFLIRHTTGMMESLKTTTISRSFYLKNIAPIAIFFAASLVFSNKAYLYLSVSFIQMLKAVTPMVILILSFIAKLEKASTKIVTIISMVSIGVIIASYGEINFVWMGVAFQLLAIFLESVRLILVQILLSSSGVKLDPLSALYLFAPLCFLTNTIMFFIFEFPNFEFYFVMDIGIHIFLLNGLVALALNISVVLLLKHTTSLVYTLSGVIKDIIMILLSSILFSTVITATQAAGYSISMTGIILYNRMKLDLPINFKSFIQSVIMGCCICGCFYLISNWNHNNYTNTYYIDQDAISHTQYKNCHWLEIGRHSPVTQNSEYSWVYSISESNPDLANTLLKGILISIRSLRHLNTQADIVLLVTQLDQTLFEKWWPLLWSLQVRVVPTTSPFDLSSIDNKLIKNSLSKNVGWKDFISIRSLHLLEYDKVIYLNPEAIILDSIDELFQYPNAAHSQTLNDYCLTGPIVFDPSLQPFDDLLQILYKEDFAKGSEKEKDPNSKCDLETIHSLLNFYSESKKPSIRTFQDMIYNFQSLSSSQITPKLVQKSICNSNLDQLNHKSLCEKVETLMNDYQKMNSQSLRQIQSKKIPSPLRLSVLDEMPPFIPPSGIRVCDKVTE